MKFCEKCAYYELQPIPPGWERTNIRCLILDCPNVWDAKELFEPLLNQSKI